MEINLAKFLKAQDNTRLGSYSTILATISSGAKTTKGLWHIFPRYIDLGSSRQSQYFGITEYNEALEYFAHPILGNRLHELCKALLLHKEKPIQDLFMEKDICRILSCMTLFENISPDNVFTEILDVFYKGERCAETLKCIEADTMELSFELLTQTANPAQIDEIVNSCFPKYGNTVANRMDYSFLKQHAISLKAMIYKSNTLNDRLIAAITKVLDENTGNTNINTDKTVLLTSIRRGENNIRGTIGRCSELNTLLHSYNKNGWYCSPYWAPSGNILGLNITFVIVHLAPAAGTIKKHFKL